MGDVLSTNLSNLNDIFTSPDWSPPSAIYSNFNFSTWTIPSFPAVPSGNQVRKEHAYLLVLVKLKLNIVIVISQVGVFREHKFICCCGTQIVCFAIGSSQSVHGLIPVQR